jgi:hypothetical protein
MVQDTLPEYHQFSVRQSQYNALFLEKNMTRATLPTSILHT